MLFFFLFFSFPDPSLSWCSFGEFLFYSSHSSWQYAAGNNKGDFQWSKDRARKKGRETDAIESCKYCSQLPQKVEKPLGLRTFFAQSLFEKLTQRGALASQLWRALTRVYDVSFWYLHTKRAEYESDQTGVTRAALVTRRKEVKPLVTSRRRLWRQKISLARCMPIPSRCHFFLFRLEAYHEEWDVFTKFRAKLPAGRTDWRAFQLTFILYGGRRRRRFGGPLWKENRAIMLCHHFWVFPGCFTKTDSCKFELVPAKHRVFEETFTDWLWRLVRHVEDSLKSLNSAGLFASTTLLLMPACQSYGWSPFRLQTPHI